MLVGHFPFNILKHFSLVLVALGLLGCGPDRDLKDEVFYFVMPDRFENGDPSNDTGGLDGDRQVHGFDASSQAFYHGGDLKGLIKRLPYIEQLGVTSIWMTPIFKNSPVSIDGGSAAYHGYWIQDYMQVDPHFGTNDELRYFITQARLRGIKVFFDIVINHTADVIRYEECHEPDGQFPGGGFGTCVYRDTSQAPYTPFVPEELAGSKGPEWLNDTSLYHNRGDSSFTGESTLLGDFFGLDDLDTTNPVVVQGMTDIFKFWVKEYGIDGFRLDTVKNVNIEFWQEWAPAIKDFAEKNGRDDFFIFGEVFDGNPRVVSQYTTEGKLDSALDFGLYFALRDVLAFNAGPSRLADMFAQDDLYRDGDSDADTLLTFASNHDIGRLGFVIRDANPDESEAQHLARLEMAYALMYFGRGIPVIYYGDEQGFVGGIGDQLNREDMMPSLVDNYNAVDLLGTDATTADANFDTQHPMFQTLVQYKNILDLHPALRQGRQHLRYVDDSTGVIALSRVLDGFQSEYVLFLNTGNEARTVTLDATAAVYARLLPTAEDYVINQGGQVEFTVPALSAVLYKAEEEIEGPVLDQFSIAMNDGQLVQGQFEIPVNIEWLQSAPIPLTSVEFFISVDGDDFESLGTDYNAPYRAFATTGDLAEGTQFAVRAVAVDQEGNTLSDERMLEVGLAPGLEIFFQKPESWADSINIFYFDTPNAETVPWPGTPMEVLADGWYRFQFPLGATQANIIFNDGDGNQTENLTRNRDGCYVDGAWVDSCNPVFPGLSITFLKPASWGEQVFLVYRDAAPANDSEAPMENIVDDWWQLQLPNEVRAATVSFSDEIGNTTPASRRVADSCYRDGEWFDACDIPIDNAPNPYGTTLFIRGSLNDWGTADPMVYNNDRSFTGVVALAPGEYEFKIASEDWTQADFGSPDNNRAVILGETKALAFRGSNLALAIDAPSEYVFNLDATDSDRPELTVRDADVFAGTPIFLRGGMNGWAASDELVYQGAGAYQTVIPIDAGSYEFKVASEDWSSVDLGASVDSNNLLTIGENFELSPVGANIRAEFSSADYLFTLDTLSGSPSLTVVPAVPFEGTAVFLRGSFNDWGATDELSFEGAARYSVEIPIEFGLQLFKVASEDWGTVDLGGSTENSTVVTGQPFSPLVPTGTNLEFNVENPGTYRFELDFSREQSQLSVEPVVP